MKLKDFIERLKRIGEEYSENLEVVMADDIPVVNPLVSEKYHGGKVVITDQV